MTDPTIPTLTGADVRALGYEPFGFERDDRMGGVLAHRAGKAFYLCRSGAFWSIDPEYSNMRGVLCEEPPNWRESRIGCEPYLISGTDVLLWWVADLPTERAKRLFNHDTIAPVLAGLWAQADPVSEIVASSPSFSGVGEVKNVGEVKIADVPTGNGVERAPTTPTPRRPLQAGDTVCFTESASVTVIDGIVDAIRRVESGYDGEIAVQGLVDGKWHWATTLHRILDEAAGDA